MPLPVSDCVHASRYCVPLHAMEISPGGPPVSTTVPPLDRATSGTISRLLPPVPDALPVRKHVPALHATSTRPKSEVTAVVVLTTVPVIAIRETAMSCPPML